MPAEKNEVGPEPINPYGMCFDIVGHHAVYWALHEGETDFKVCHGIGIANRPGEEGRTIAHAWLEALNKSYDVVWGVWVPKQKYRADLKARDVREYGWEEFYATWRQYDYPGPWDHKVIAALQPKCRMEAIARMNEIKTKGITP